MPTPENPADLSDEMIDALLSQKGVQEVLVQLLEEIGSATPLEKLSYSARAELLSAVVADGIIEIGPGKTLSGEEFLAMLEAEENAAETKERHDGD